MHVTAFLLFNRRQTNKQTNSLPSVLARLLHVTAFLLFNKRQTNKQTDSLPSVLVRLLHVTAFLLFNMRGVCSCSLREDITESAAGVMLAATLENVFVNVIPLSFVHRIFGILTTTKNYQILHITVREYVHVFLGECMAIFRFSEHISVSSGVGSALGKFTSTLPLPFEAYSDNGPHVHHRVKS